MVCETERASIPRIGKLIGLRYFYNVPTEHPCLIVGSACSHFTRDPTNDDTISVIQNAYIPPWSIEPIDTVKIED